MIDSYPQLYAMIYKAVLRAAGELDFNGQPYGYEELANLTVRRFQEQEEGDST